jgi:MFS family permease
LTRGWWSLAGASAGLFLLMLDSTATPLALPSIRLDLGASSSGIQWAQNVYLLAAAALVATLGTLGDLLGRRRLLVCGVVVFAAGSVVCATADSIVVLVAGRGVQGLGASTILAMATVALHGKRLGLWAAVASVALAVGPLVGGAVVELASWRWIFWLNLPLAAIAVILIAAAMPESRDEGAPRRLDLTGLAMVSAGLTLVVLGLVEGESWGWSSAATLGSLAAGVALLAMRSDLSAAPRLGAMLALVGSFWTVMFLVPQYLDLALGFSTARVGVMMLPVTVPIVLWPLAARMTRRFGAGVVMAAGMACATLGVLALTRLDGSSNFYDVAPGLILFGLALGLACAPMWATAATASGAPAAGALVLAAAGAVFQHVQGEERAAGESFEGAFAAGIAGTSWLLAAILLAGTVGSLLVARRA